MSAGRKWGCLLCISLEHPPRLPGKKESHDARALVQWDHGVTCGEHGLPNLGYSAEGREVLDKAKSLAHISVSDVTAQ